MCLDRNDLGEGNMAASFGIWWLSFPLKELCWISVACNMRKHPWFKSTLTSSWDSLRLNLPQACFLHFLHFPCIILTPILTPSQLGVQLSYSPESKPTTDPFVEQSQQNMYPKLLSPDWIHNLCWLPHDFALASLQACLMRSTATTRLCERVVFNCTSLRLQQNLWGRVLLTILKCLAQLISKAGSCYSDRCQASPAAQDE